MLFSDGGLSLHVEGCADAGAPLSLDSALQERLQSQMELLEKKKNEEIQNLKTSLIAEQQVCIWVVNRPENECLVILSVVVIKPLPNFLAPHCIIDCCYNWSYIALIKGIGFVHSLR